MPVSKSELVKQLSKTYPNLLKKDLEQIFDRLWPICRSITGEGIKESLNIIKEYIPLEVDHDNKKYLSSENNSMGNLSAELATCLHVSLLFDLFQTDHHDISTVCIYDIDVHQSMSSLPSSAMATHWNCFKNTLKKTVLKTNFRRQLRK